MPPTYLQAEEDITLARQQHLHKMKQAGIFWSSKLLFQDFYFVLFLNEKCLTKLGSWTKAAPHSPPKKIMLLSSHYAFEIVGLFLS